MSKNKKEYVISDADLKRLERELSLQSNFKTSTGYTGNSKTVAEKKAMKKKKKKRSDAQRKIDHLSRKQKRTLWQLQNHNNKLLNKNSNISRKEEGKVTKKDIAKAGGLKAEGIWSHSAYENYEKKTKTFLKFCVEKHDIKRIGDIRPRMVQEFLQEQIDKGNSAKTVGGYLSQIKKLSEFAVKDGIHSMKRIVNKTINEMVPEYNSKDYRRGVYEGYTVKDVQVMARQAEKHFGLYHRAAIETMGYGGLRLDEFRKIKWKDLDFENNTIDLRRYNMTKNGRPRISPMPEKTMQLFRAIKNAGLHSSDDERIFGSRMNEDNVRDFIKECARQGKVKYSAAHDFRRATIQFNIREMEKGLKKGTLTKEMIVDNTLKIVNSDPRLNPLVPVKVPEKDSKGNIVWRTRKNGTKYYKTVPKLDENGNPVMKLKYTKEELMNKRIDYVKNIYLSEVLGHNRTSITATYKKEENKRQKHKQEEKKK